MILVTIVKTRLNRAASSSYTIEIVGLLKIAGGECGGLARVSADAFCSSFQRVSADTRSLFRYSGWSEASRPRKTRYAGSGSPFAALSRPPMASPLMTPWPRCFSSRPARCSTLEDSRRERRGLLAAWQWPTAATAECSSSTRRLKPRLRSRILRCDLLMLHSGIVWNPAKGGVKGDGRIAPRKGRGDACAQMCVPTQGAGAKSAAHQLVLGCSSCRCTSLLLALDAPETAPRASRCFNDQTS
jgi:hypothetical protein